MLFSPWARSEIGAPRAADIGEGAPVLKISLALDGRPRAPVRGRKSWRDVAMPSLHLKPALELSFPGLVARSSSADEPSIADGRDDEPEPPLPFEAAKPGPPPRRNEAAAERRLPDFSLIEGWAIPPVRWGGSTSSSLSWNESSGGASNLSNANQINLNAASYIYQPWYAQVSGNLGLLKSDSKQSGTGPSTTSQTTSLNYGGNLSLFPQSRFPLQAYVQQSHSQAEANATSTDYTSTRFGVRQSYRALRGQGHIAGNFDRSVVETAQVRSVVDAMQGTYTDAFGNHGIGAATSFSQTSGDVGGQHSSLFSVSGTHNWHGEEERLSVSSRAVFSDNQIRTLSGDQLIGNHSQIVQLNNSFSWLPSEELPISVVGGGNFLNQQTDIGTGGQELTNLNLFTSANYRVSNNLQAFAGLTANQTQSNGASQFSSGQNLSLSYSGNPLTFGNYLYSWGTGAGVSNHIVSEGKGSQTFSGSAQHSLVRDITLSETSAIMMNASQAFSVTGGSQSGQNNVVTHNGGTVWRLTLGERTVGSLSASASDTQAFGELSSHYRSFSSQGSVQSQLTNRSDVMASLNFVFSQQVKVPQQGGSDSSLNGTSTLNGGGQVTYNHRNPFGVPNLFYTASLMTNMSKTNQRVVSGDPNASLWQSGTVFQQSLDYRVGRLIFRATTSISELNGKENASAFFSANRMFGNF